MATEIRLWQIVDGKLQGVEGTSFAAHYLEKHLEDLLASEASMLGDALRVIDRQREIPGVGIFDLLCIDSRGRLVIVELKRDQTPRQAVAQALHYASWIDGVEEGRIRDNAHDYLERPLEAAFEERFGIAIPEIDPQLHP
jgi:RecB family endonuclease NucS